MTRRLKIITGLLALALGTSAAQAGDVAAGKVLAKKFCARCHVIDLENPFGGIGSSPGFPLMAKNAEMFRPRIRTFEVRRPHAQYQWDVSARDIEDLVTYIMSLTVE